MCDELEWDLLPSLFFSLANKTDVAPNKNKAKKPDMKVLMHSGVFWAGKIAAVPK